MYVDEAYFIFKDRNSKDFNIFLAEYPPLIIPKKRINEIKIEGRNGTLHETDNCYDSYQFNLICYSNNIDISKVATWLCGTGYLTISNNDTQRYKVTIKDTSDLELIGPEFNKFTITLNVEPYIEEIKENEIILTGEDEFTINSTIDTPFILEIGIITDTITITVNNVSIKVEKCTDFLLDTDLLVAYENKYNNAMPKITGSVENVILKPDTNNVKIIGSFENAKIRYRGRDLC